VLEVTLRIVLVEKDSEARFKPSDNIGRWSNVGLMADTNETRQV
jgi:hypothetical protein